MVYNNNINQKPLVLIYEGISGSGKTTLSKEFQTETGYGILSIDRFTPSIWVYSTYRNEFILKSNQLAEEILEKFFKVYIVWCKCDADVAYKRCLEKHKIGVSLKELEQINSLFNYYFSEVTLFSNIIEINTEESIKNSVNKIIESVFKK